jgi:hypothetical protein
LQASTQDSVLVILLFLLLVDLCLEVRYLRTRLLLLFNDPE